MILVIVYIFKVLMEEIKYNIDDNLEASPDYIDNLINDEVLLLNINGYEGAIDLLLDLAKRQKVDLLNISISSAKIFNSYLIIIIFFMRCLFLMFYFQLEFHFIRSKL